MKMMVCLHEPDDSRELMRKALGFAELMSAEVYLVHVVPPDPDFIGYEPGPQTVRDNLAKRFRVLHEALEAKAETLRKKGIDATALLVQGPTAETLLDEAGKRAVDLIVLGSHNNTIFHDLVAGSVQRDVARTSNIPVLVIPQTIRPE